MKNMTVLMSALFCTISNIDFSIETASSQDPAYHEILTNFNFFRISRSQLINLKYIKKFNRKRNPTITMVDGTVLTVSFGRKAEFLNSINDFI